jgi:sulfatase modifying factor 1
MAPPHTPSAPTPDLRDQRAWWAYVPDADWRRPEGSASDVGHEGTSPCGAFPPNGYGLYDMTGNVWEWTCDHYRAVGDTECCGSGAVGDAFPRQVIKGRSHPCAPNSCLRYRPAARQGESIDTSTGHLGFRCVLRRGHEGGT